MFWFPGLDIHQPLQQLLSHVPDLVKHPQSPLLGPFFLLLHPFPFQPLPQLPCPSAPHLHWQHYCSWLGCYFCLLLCPNQVSHRHFHIDNTRFCFHLWRKRGCALGKGNSILPPHTGPCTPSIPPRQQQQRGNTCREGHEGAGEGIVSHPRRAGWPYWQKRRPHRPLLLSPPWRQRLVSQPTRQGRPPSLRKQTALRGKSVSLAWRVSHG
mmetsp:Transcript_12899/g.26711  ORF Transcript_12899/g.26711 Transcript_12899/m.26711 type:complete len:210 (-) Transcript_12899:441-1070(-)